MKRIISFIVILNIFSSLFLQNIYAQDKVVAIVNNEVITQKDLTDFLNFIRLQYSREIKGKELEEKITSMKLDLLQRLIEDRIILQQAKIDKITVEPSRIKEKINEIKRRYALESDFERDLAKQGLVQADLENKIREQMLTFTIVEKNVRSKIVVSPDEITSFFEQNKSQFLKTEERVLTVIILRDKDLANNMIYQLRIGKKIEDLASKFSFSTNTISASQGQQLSKEIEDTVFKLGIGEISSPVKIKEQYFIFRLDNIIGPKQLTLEQSQDKIQAYLFEKKLQEALNKWLDEIKKQSYIKILED